MNRLIRRSLVLVILAGTVLAAGSTAKADVPDEWKSLDVAGLTTLAKQFVAQGADGVDNCKQLAAYVAERYATASAAGQVNWDEWIDLAGVLGSYYPAATQVAMGNGIQQSLAPDEATIKQLTADKLNKVCEALLNLRQLAPAGSISATWTNATDAWKSWEPKDLFWLATALWESDASGKPVRLKLANHISEKYLADKATTKTVSCEYWKRFAQCFGKDLSVEARAQWAEKIRTAFTDGEQGLGALQARDLSYLLWALKLLGDKEITTVTAQWIDATTAWKSREPAELFWLAMVLTDSPETCKPARLKLAEHVGSKYLADAAKTRLISGAYWARFIWCFGKDLSAEARSQWAVKIRAAFADIANDMKARQFKYLADALVRLDASQTAPLVVVWLLNNDEAIGKASTSELAQIASSGRTEKAAMAPVMKVLEQLWLARYEKKLLGPGESVSIARAWLAMGDKAKAQVWTMRAHEVALGSDEAVASIDAKSLMLLGRLLGDAGLTGQGKEHQAFAVALVRLAGQDKILTDKPWRYWYYAAPLGTAETRQALRAGLADKDGNARLVVARILARAYRDAADRNNWLAFLDGKVAASAGDAKTLWLLARAYGEASVPLRAEPQPIRARKWLEQVLDTTQTASLRIAAIEQLALGYATARKHPEGTAFLNSAANRFTDEQTAVAIEALCAEHVASEVRYLKRQIAFSRICEKNMNALAAGAQEDKDREFFLKWAAYDQQKEEELSQRLEQIEQ